jgi:hypothetical protein
MIWAILKILGGFLAFLCLLVIVFFFLCLIPEDDAKKDRLK